jgi:hypothetical protein
MELKGKVLTLAPLFVGLAFGVFVLHPIAMLYHCAAGGAWVDRVSGAFLSSFDGGMGGMVVLFAALGVCLAALSQAARPHAAATVCPAAPRAALQRLCMYCKAMPQRGSDGADHWLPLEQVLYHSQGLEFSHGVCPRCQARFLEPQIAALKGEKDPTP